MSSREKILRCATEMFYQVGYSWTSVDDILKRSGVAKSNFYYHFESKEELALAVLDLWLADQEASMVRTLQCADCTPKERLKLFLDQVCSSQAEYANMAGCPFGNFAAALPVRECDDRYDRFRRKLSEMFERIEATVTRCLAEGAEMGEFRSDIPPAELATLIWATLQGLLMLTKTHRSTRALRMGCGRIYQLILACW